MTNRFFCYWLQGYFEISREADLTKEKVIVINNTLSNISEPLGEFTQWLSDVLTYLSSLEYRQSLLDFFLPEITDRLNLVFHHVIDHSYDRNISLEESIRIHNGETT